MNGNKHQGGDKHDAHSAINQLASGGRHALPPDSTPCNNGINGEGYDQS